MIPGCSIEDISPSRKYTIIDLLRNMLRIEDYYLQKLEFLRIKFIQSVTLDSL
jgi:hypothetical protein